MIIWSSYFLTSSYGSPRSEFVFFSFRRWGYWHPESWRPCLRWAAKMELKPTSLGSRPASFWLPHTASLVTLHLSWIPCNIVLREIFLAWFCWPWVWMTERTSACGSLLAHNQAFHFRFNEPLLCAEHSSRHEGNRRLMGEFLTGTLPPLARAEFL